MTRPLPLLDGSATPADSTANDAGCGALETPQGRLPLVAMDVRASIVDLTARVIVRQTFKNALDRPLEATYVFPLPERAAVVGFRMHVADRTIDGLLEERAAARDRYDAAIEQGHRAAIAEEDRSGVFSLRVGNLPPRETATIELTLVGPVTVAEGEATFRFPLVVAPRYVPGIPLDGPSVGDGTASDTDQAPDASRISPPVLLPGFPNPVRLSLEVQLDPAGIAATQADWSERVRCSLHATIDRDGPPWTVALQPGERLDRDFLLRFPVATKSLGTSLRVATGTGSQAGTFALTLLPPQIASEARPRSRDVVFVLDRSGSMSGWKMVAARRALGRMLDTLLEQDRIGLVAFDSVVEHAPGSNGGLVAATDRERWKRVEWLGTIEARGGTELGLALDDALRQFDAAGTDPSRERVLVLVTDGHVSGEDAILRQLGGRAAGLPRIFTVGIDQAVNAGFLRRLADLGRGSCELVESEDRLDAFLESIERVVGRPALTDIRVEPLGFDAIAADFAPARIPDLHADRPVTILGRHLARRTDVRMKVVGTLPDGSAWSMEVAGRTATAETLAPQWGRARVRDLEDQYAAGATTDADALQKRIVAVSLESGVLSRFTAYVAVDVSEVANPGGKPQRIMQPVEAPAGWEEVRGNMVFGYASPQSSMVRACVAAPMEAAHSKRSLRSLNPLVDYSLIHSLADAAPPAGEPMCAGSAAEGGDDSEFEDVLEGMPGDFDDAKVDFAESAIEGASPVHANDGEERSAVAKATKLLLIESVQGGAKEIQIESWITEIRLRSDRGAVASDWGSLPFDVLAGMIARLKVLAGLDPAVTDRPQSGRLRIEWNEGTAEFDLVCAPGPQGETLTLTLLDLAPPQPSTAPAAPRRTFWT